MIVGEYGIVANVLETDHVFRKGAKAWIAGGTGGEGWHRFEWIALSRGGRQVRKWAPTIRFSNFRAAWIPDHIRAKLYPTEMNMTGTKEEMILLAAQLEYFAEEQRVMHPNRQVNGPAMIH